MVPDELHEWVSIEDPEEQRTWVFDLTYLTSPWRCIFGAGCEGVLTGPAADLVHGCCSYGAHFVDEEDESTTLAYAERLTDDQWQHKALAARKGGATKRNKDGDLKTRVVDGACIFLNRTDFHRGPGCALHVGALDAGERPLDWKPDVCWQLPLRLEEATNDQGHVTSTLREWKRRDWGAGGDDFHWWCTEDPEAFVDHQPVYVTNRDEIAEMVGAEVYQMLADYLAARGTERLLPHPALKRKEGLPGT
jgi:hypothetical protein